LVGDGAGDAAHHLLEARVGLLLGDPFLLHLAGELPGGHVAGFLDRGVDELLVDVLDHDWDVGGGDRLRDLATHRASADNGGLGYEHSGRSSLSGACLRRRAATEEATRSGAAEAAPATPDKA